MKFNFVAHGVVVNSLVHFLFSLIWLDK